MTTSVIPSDSHDQARHNTNVWWLGYIAIVGSGLLIAGFSRRRFAEPFLGLSLAIILVLLIGWLIRPRATLYVTLALTAVSDLVTVAWFPFVKNLSSRESISFVADALTISPLDLALGIGFVISLIRRYARTRTLLAPNPLTFPLILFTLFVVYGFARGLTTGGDARVAVLEGRPLFYILLTFAIVINECTEDAHYRHAVWAVITGVLIQSLLSIDYLGRLDPVQRENLEGLNEHGSALGHNLVIVTFLGFLLLRVRRPVSTKLLAASLIPVVYIIFVSQRRAGVATLVVAGAMMAIALFWRNRRMFWLATPILTLVLAGYVGAFWNSTSSAGFPAQAVKSIIAPGSANAEDASSDLYRIIEAYDLNFTIRTDPLKGLGFGRAFYRPIALPDISVFELNAFQPHNSVLWIWIKMGFGGFVTMFYLFGKTIVVGAERVRRMAVDQDLVIALSGLLFVVMYAMYSFVDVSWDARNTVLLGLAMAICVRPFPDDRETDAEAESSVATDQSDLLRTERTTAATPSA